jgi:hypothetical protein
MGTSRAIPAITNTFMPTGGVISPISNMMTALCEAHLMPH